MAVFPESDPIAVGLSGLYGTSGSKPLGLYFKERVIKAPINKSLIEKLEGVLFPIGLMFDHDDIHLSSESVNKLNSANLFDQNVEFLRIAFWQIILAAGPLLAIGLAVGLTIGIIQAATSINEMTLSFVPKLVIVMISFGFLSNFILTQLTDYFGFIFDQIANIS